MGLKMGKWGREIGGLEGGNEEWSDWKYGVENLSSV